MAAPLRPLLATKKSSAMRPPSMRPPPSRSQTPGLNGRLSPTGSVASSHRSPPKRKERDFEQEPEQETNINVVVRCRGRNDREVRENSGVVVSTDGVKGKKVELSMGASALSNKTYHFDKVFSAAADQGIVFDEVVAPILDEVCEKNSLLQSSLTHTYRLYPVSIVPSSHMAKRAQERLTP